jgi:glycosyltransferase involved in cell wall biosynthesis
MQPDPSTPSTLPDTARIGYVLKMYPRFSETFIVTEMLELEARGVDLEIFSLRLPSDGRFHPDLAAVRAPVTYLQPGTLKADGLWQALASYLSEVGSIPDDLLADLAASDPRDAAQALDLARAVQAHGITHLHAHFGSVATTVARLAAALSGIGYSFTAHAKDIFHQDVDDADLSRKLADARAVVTVSDFNLAHLRDRYGEAASRVVRLHNGIALDRFPFTAPGTGVHGQDVPVITSVGRLVEKKGLDTLVDAAALLRDRGVPMRVEIIGSGGLEQELADRIASRDLSDHVVLRGPMPQDRVREHVRDATVFAAPCRIGADGNRDGLPTVLLESMALGTVCVSTPVTGIPEAIRDGETGTLVPPDDPVALADALETLLADPGLRATYARAARARIEEAFDARRQAGRLLEVFAAIHAPAAPDVPAPARIALVCTDPGIPVFGTKGASVHLQSVLTVLLEAGHEVHVLTPRPGDLTHPLATRAHVHPLPAIRGADAAEREQSARDSDAAVPALLDAIGPDLVYERYALWGRSATGWAATHQVPSVLEVNAPLPIEQARHRELVGADAAEQVARRAFGAADLVTCVSAPVADWARRLCPTARTRVLPNGVDPARITPRPAPTTAAEHSTAPLTVGFLGTLKPWHGIDVLLDAVALGRSRGRDWRLLVVGDGPLRADSEARARALGVPAEFTGATAADGVGAQLHRMDVACAPYPVQEEDYFSPLKVYEYLAAGLPVVASAVGQIPEILDHGRLGVLVDPSDAPQLADAIAALEDDPTLRQALGDRARQAVLDHHTWHAVVASALDGAGITLGEAAA